MVLTMTKLTTLKILTRWWKLSTYLTTFKTVTMSSRKKLQEAMKLAEGPFGKLQGPVKGKLLRAVMTIIKDHSKQVIPVSLKKVQLLLIKIPWTQEMGQDFFSGQMLLFSLSVL